MPPPILYKYCSGLAIDILEKLRLKITPPNRFNDPFELTPKTPKELAPEKAIDALSEDRVLRVTYHQAVARGDFPGSYEQFRAFINQNSEIFAAGLMASYPESAANFRREHIEMISAEFGLLCLSEVHDDILMWSHYSDRHTGFVIGFDTSHPSFKSPPLHQVTYLEERALVEHSVAKDDPKRAEQINALIRRKSPHWKYEKEWRQLHFLATCVKDDDTEMRTTRYYRPIEPSLIREVFIGCRTPDRFATHVRQILADAKFSRVALRKLIIHETDFSLVPEDYSTDHTKQGAH